MIRAWLDLSPAGIFAVLIVLYFGMPLLLAVLAFCAPFKRPIQSLGGVAVGDPRHVAELTRIERAPDGCEEVPSMISRLLLAHESILIDARDAAKKASDHGDDGTNDLIVSSVVRLHEQQVWFLAEHLVDTPFIGH